MLIGIIASIVLAVLVFSVWFFRYRDTKAASTEAPSTNNKSYKAVRVNPHQHACNAAFECHHRIYLVAEAPMLPLPDCNKSESCRCGYVHYDDRRQGDRRGNAVAITSQDDKKERRNKSLFGRRKLDKVN